MMGCSTGRGRCCGVRVVVVVVFVALLVTWSDAQTEKYFRNKLLRLRPETPEQFRVIHGLHENPPSYLQNLDFWSEPSSFGKMIYLRVKPDQDHIVRQMLGLADIPYDVVVHDVQKLIDEHARWNLAARAQSQPLSIYDSYLTYDEMLSWMEDSRSLCGKRCSFIDIGQSFEGRRLIVVKITNGDDRRKPGVWIDAGIHAREWISHATALYFIDRLVLDYVFDQQLQSLMDKFDFYIMPCANPDGYHYTHKTNRLWRKTRSRNEESLLCRGTDANRNFDFHWGEFGASANPCSDIYRGSKPFSENESKAIADFIMARNSTWKVYLALHSYFQMWMAPYGYSTTKPDNYEAQMRAADAAKIAIKTLYGTEYKIGSASDVLYRSSGTSRDWAAGVPMIPYVYTVELRDQGSYGFLLPPDQILPTGAETWEGVKALLDEILRIDKEKRRVSRQ